MYYRELDAKYKTVRRFLPALVEHIRFGANAAGEPVVAAFAWLRANLARKKLTEDAPREIVGKAWQRHVVREDGSPMPTPTPSASRRTANGVAAP